MRQWKWICGLILLSLGVSAAGGYVLSKAFASAPSFGGIQISGIYGVTTGEDLSPNPIYDSGMAKLIAERLVQHNAKLTEPGFPATYTSKQTARQSQESFVIYPNGQYTVSYLIHCGGLKTDPHRCSIDLTLVDEIEKNFAAQTSLTRDDHEIRLGITKAVEDLAREYQSMKKIRAELWKQQK